MRLSQPKTDRQYFLDLDYQLYKELNNVKIKVSLEVQVKPSQNRMHFVNQTLDVCSIISNGARNWQIKTVLGDLNKYPNVPKSCPIRPGHYFIKNYTTDISQIPMAVVPELLSFANFEVFTIIKKRLITTNNINVDAELKYNEL